MSWVAFAVVLWVLLALLVVLFVRHGTRQYDNNRKEEQ